MTSFFVHRLCPLSLGDENGTLEEDFLAWSDQLINRLSHHQEKPGPPFFHSVKYRVDLLRRDSR
jgi:hypothetical protein